VVGVVGVPVAGPRDQPPKSERYVSLVSKICIQTCDVHYYPSIRYDYY